MSVCWGHGIVVFNHAKVCIRISFSCIQTGCKTLNGIKRSRFIDTCVIGEFIEPLRNQSGKYSYTWVFVKCIAFNEFYLFECLRDSVGLLDESCKLCYARGSMLTGFVQQDLLYENHKCPCVASAKCLSPKTKIYAFSFENTKVLNVLLFMYSVFFCRTLREGFGNTQEDKMFSSLCNVECIYFWWFSKHGWNLLFRFHQ